MAMGDVIGRLSVVLGLDTAAFESGARRAAKTTQESGDRFERMGTRVGTAAKALVGLGAAIAGSEIVGQIKDMAMAGLEHASALGEQAQQLGVTTGELQRYRYIASQVGIDQDVMDKGLAKLSITLGQLSAGAKGPAEALARLGFSQSRIAEISKMTAGDAIPALAEGFAKLKSPTEAAAIAADLFGSKMGGKFLSLLMGGKQGIDDLTGAYRKLGIEITESQIKKADEAMDKMAALQQATEAARAKVAADNAEGILRGTEAWEGLKTAAIVAMGKLAELDQAGGDMFDRAEKWWDGLITERLSVWQQRWNDFNAWWEQSKARFEGLKSWFTKLLTGMGTGFENLTTTATTAARQLYEGVKTWLWDRLNSIWDGAKKKIEETKQRFYGLYDAVVGHSYIPDMVDGIALHMARLDDVMVKPAKTATERTRQEFEKLQHDVQGLMENLFPESRDLADFQKALRTFDKGIKAGGAGGYSADQLRAGRARLIEQADPAMRARTALPLADQLGLITDISRGPMLKLQGLLAQLPAAVNDNADEIGVANVRIAKSFKDMATESMNAVRNLSDAIKGGDFFDILDSLIAVGLQLGSLGVFGDSFKAKVNGVPKFAGGTRFAPGGLSLVGERGPELVNLPRGAQVIPNHAMKGAGSGGNTYHIQGNLLTEEFWQRIQAGDMAAAKAGADGGVRQMALRQSRRVA